MSTASHLLAGGVDIYHKQNFSLPECWLLTTSVDGPSITMIIITINILLLLFDSGEFFFFLGNEIMNKKFVFVFQFSQNLVVLEWQGFKNIIPRNWLEVSET